MKNNMTHAWGLPLSIFALFLNIATTFSQTKSTRLLTEADCSIHCGNEHTSSAELLAVSVTKLKYIPSVIKYDATGNVLIEATITGTPSRVTLRRDPNFYDFNDSGINGDRVAGDNIYTLSQSAQSIVSLLIASDAYRPFIGFLELYEGGVKQSQRNVFHQIRTADMPDVTIQGLGNSSNVQVTDRVFNTIGNNSSPSFTTMAQRFYQYYPDNFDFLNFLCVPGYLDNRYHFGTLNNTSGIGLNPFNSTANYGSAGFLKGCNVFPIPMLYEPAGQGYVHEIGHQWINFTANTPFAVGTPHWPMSNVASAVMGFSIGGAGGAGGNFNYTFTPQTGGYQIGNLTPTAFPVFNQWEKYLMGLIPKTDVTTTAVILNSQVAAPSLGFHPSSEFTEYTINNLVATLGERVPNSVNSQKNFRAALILISDELLNANEMAYYHFMTLRADSRTSVAAAEGFDKRQGTPFYLATSGLATLNTSLTNAIIPVELVYFEAKKSEDNALLEWKTATEINVRNFEIQKSLDGQKFETIAEIKPAKSNTSTPSVYLSSDKQFHQSSYYKLKINDMDNKTAFSKTVFLEKEGDKSIIIQWHTEGVIFIETADKIESIILTNSIGQVVKTTSSARFSINDLAVGVYIVSVKTDKGLFSQKIVRK